MCANKRLFTLKFVISLIRFSFDEATSLGAGILLIHIIIYHSDVLIGWNLQRLGSNGKSTIANSCERSRTSSFKRIIPPFSISSRNQVK